MRQLALAAVAAVAVVMAGRADEEKVPLDKAPKAVVEAAKKRFPKAEVVEITKETEKDKTVYEVELKLNGKAIDVTLTPDGALVSIEQEIDAKELPKAVAEALDKKYPKAAFKKTEVVYKVANGKEELAYYEVDLETADKTEVEVKLAADGKFVEEEVKKPEKKEEKKGEEKKK